MLTPSNINDRWGTIAHVTLDDVLGASTNYWSELLYDRKLLVLRGLHHLSSESLWQIRTLFGTPWTEADYALTREGTSQQSRKPVTVYGSSTVHRNIGENAMPWHRDIPWHRSIRYPIRSLYPTALDNNAAGNTTVFCDADWAWQRTTPEEREQLRDVRIRIQNWYQMLDGSQKPSTQLIPLIERHPHTQRWSCLLNSFGYDHPLYLYQAPRQGTWIVDVEREAESIGLDLIELLHSRVCVDSNIYAHEWRLGDLVLFDNYSGIFHRRGALQAADSSKPIKREFWRLNVKHYWQK